MTAIRKFSGVIFSLMTLSVSFASAEVVMDRSVPPALQQQLKQDLEFSGSLEGGRVSSLYRQVFKTETLSGEGLSKFFADRIFRFDMNECGGPPAVACVRPYIDQNTMWITRMYAETKMSQLLRVAIIIHEARHTEVKNSFWSHANCPIPFLDEDGKDIVSLVSGAKLEGRSACDIVPQGSYGLEAILLKNVEHSCTNCNEKSLMDAKIYGDDAIKRISDPTARKLLKDDLRSADEN